MGEKCPMSQMFVFEGGIVIGSKKGDKNLKSVHNH